MAKDKDIDNDIQDEEIKELLPSMNLGLDKIKEDKKCIVSDEMMIGIYGEILKDVRTDKEQINDVLDNFLNMVINDGDGSTSSKEAVVNLLKLKSEQADKMTKVADLMTRIKLKDANTFPAYLAAHQNNTVNISSEAKKDIIKKLNKNRKEKGKTEK